MLSIYLLVQKNTKKLQNLLLIGYSTGKVAMPYQLLTIGLNLTVLIISIIIVAGLRHYYMDIVKSLFPESNNGTIIYSVILGCIIFTLVTMMNIMTIRNKIRNI